MGIVSYHDMIVNTETEFEQTFPHEIQKSVISDHYSKKKKLDMKKVNQLCKDYGITYSQYQQMESLYINKLQYVNVII